jgi:hypothetical protein
MWISIKNILTQLKNKKSLILWCLLSIFLLLGLALRWDVLEVVRLNQWLTRDIDRAFSLYDGNYFPLSGPETTNGMRLPGPFLYLSMSVALFFHYSYDAIFIFYLILNFSSLLLSFYIIKKYFDFNTAFLTTALQSTHLLYIEAITFPINPAFLLPLIPFIFWSVFEFTLNKNEKALPLIALFIFLGMQIHMSIATYLLVPIVAGFIFRIKISLKTIIKIVLIGLICFSPFYYDLNHSYKAPLSINHVTKFDPFVSFIEPFKILFTQNTINRLGDFSVGQSNMANFLGISDLYTTIQLTLINGSFLGLILVIFYKIRKRDVENGKKELMVLLLFYCPALIYDLIRPWSVHYWYNYIFILPATLMISRLLIIIKDFFNTKIAVLLFQFALFILVSYLTWYNTSSILSVKNRFQNRVEIGQYKNFEMYRQLLKLIKKNLKLSSKDYINRIYFEDISPNSERLIKLEKSNNNDSINPNKNPNCFYFYKYEFAGGKQTVSYKRKKIDYFLKDNSIKILRNNVFKFPVNSAYLNVQKKYGFITYLRKNEQPCYTNSFNIFSSTFEDKVLLDDYFEYQNTKTKFLVKQLGFDSKNRLEKLKIKYIFSNEDVVFPVRFQIDLNKNIDNYDLKLKIDSYSWGINETDNFFYKNLDLKVFDGKRLLKKFEVISKDSWIGNGYGINKDIFSWYRDYQLEKGYDFQKNKFHFEISGKLIFFESNNQEEKDINFLIPVNLN